MYISSRTAQLRNISVAIVNGSITLIILLIAPLGLAAVIVNTLLIPISTYLVASGSDRVIGWLLPTSQQSELFSQENSGQRRSSRSGFLRRINQRRDEP